jgi:cystathionine gamma-lyase
MGEGISFYRKLFRFFPNTKFSFIQFFYYYYYFFARSLLPPPHKLGVHLGWEYSRTGNPTRDAFETQIAALENAKYGLAFASGSAATATVLHLLPAGSHVITVDDIYGGTQRYFRRIAGSTNNLTFSFVDFNTEGEFEAAQQENTKLVWLETPTNPTLKISDIEKVAKVCKEKGYLLVVDNTFMTPYFQNPLDLGADMVVHSGTKYLNGHSDVVLGVVCTNCDDLNTRLHFLQNGLGAILSPFDSYMVMRGMKTLALRMQRHGENAQAVAEFLEAHPKVEKVVYPGLKSHPQHDIAVKQTKRGHGGMITCYLKGGIDESRVFLEKLKLFACAESLGAVECLAEHPAIMTHASVPPEMRAKLGISDNMVRLSIGIEEIEDIISDLTAGLDAIQ